MFRSTVFVLSTLVAFATADRCSAQDSPLYRLANQYKAEVIAFEKVVAQTRGIDRFDERLVDNWSDAVEQMRLAAKNPRHFNKLFHQWRKVQSWRAKTETTIFGKYAPTHDMIGQWERVLLAEAIFAEEFYLHVENPGHNNSVNRLDRPSSRRDSYLGQPIVIPQVEFVQP